MFPRIQIHWIASRWCLNYISFNEWNLIRLPGQERVCDHNEVFLPLIVVYSLGTRCGDPSASQTVGTKDPKDEKKFPVFRLHCSNSHCSTPTLIYVQRQENKESTLPYKGSPLHRIYVPVQLQPSISLYVVCNCFDQNMKSHIAYSQGFITYRQARSHAEPCQQPSSFLQFFSLWRPYCWQTLHVSSISPAFDLCIPRVLHWCKKYLTSMNRAALIDKNSDLLVGASLSKVEVQFLWTCFCCETRVSV